MNKGERVQGFLVTEIKESRELGGRLHYLKHEKLGTELVWFDSGETNKLFCIGFKTIPSDSTGVFHILEHSVLCGSEKYPLKEPFVNLLKSSMNTFLNAMTYPDKTLYPVSSRNPKDFLNLAGVYLDAVFAPSILRNPNIFYQEGWHIEQDENGRLSYKGVVFNEMKGAMSSKDGRIGRKLISLLFPDQCYGVVSGGDPECIPDLTYESFLETYKRFYHPSNARIYLDGSVPFKETMELIESYLNGYERLEVLPEVDRQTPCSGEKTIFYAIGEEEDTKDKSQLTIAKIFADWNEPVKSYAAAVLFNALSDSNDSVFKKAVLESGLARDLEISVNDEIAQIYYTLDVSNVADGKEEELITLIKNVAKEQIESGIDRKALTASINALEYRMKAPAEPAGLIRCTKAFSSWLYGGDPIMYLEYDALFKQLRDMLDCDYYENLLAELLLNEEGLCAMKSLPSKTLTKEQDAKELKRLKDIALAWSEEDRVANMEMNDILQKWQQTPDSKEAQATIPVLSLSEVNPDPYFTDTLVSKVLGATQLYHPVSTNGIVHINMYFSLAGTDIEDLLALSCLRSILSYIPTLKRSALELEQEIKTYLGDLSFRVGVYSHKDCKEVATPVLEVSCSVLEENLEYAYDLIYEILTESVFNKGDIENILRQDDIKAKQFPLTSGQIIGRLVASAPYSAANTVEEVLNGYSHIKWLRYVVADFDSNADSLITLLKKTLKEVCCQSRLTFSITAASLVDMSSFIARFKEGDTAPDPCGYTALVPKDMGIKIPALIGYAVQASDLSDMNEEYDGSMGVAANLLSLEYFWNKVRVQGGAYGSGLRIWTNGGIVTYSYRDPSPKRSIDVNLGAGDCLREYCENKGEIDKFIISTVAGTEPLIPPQTRGYIADTDYFCGYSFEDLKTQRKQMLETDYDKLLHVADIIDKFANEGNICITGPGEKLSEFEGLDIRDLYVSVSD